MYILSDKVVESLVKRAVDYGVSSWGKKDNTRVLQTARFWLYGYITGNSLTLDDAHHLYETLDNYHFKKDEEE